MRLVRWLRRGVAPNGMLMEPGSEMAIDDAVILGSHMMDVGTGIAGPEQPARAGVVFRADLAHVPALADAVAEMGAKYPRLTAPDGSALVYDAELNHYAPEVLAQSSADEAQSVAEAADQTPPEQTASEVSVPAEPAADQPAEDAAPQAPAEPPAEG